MAMLNTNSSYGFVAKTFHWLLALMLLGMIAGGFFIDSLERGDPLKQDLLGKHRMLGATVLALMLLRFVWRLCNPKVDPPDSVGRPLQILGTLAHYGLYFLVVLQALAGVMMVQLNGYPVFLFGLELPVLVGESGLLATVEGESAKAMRGFFRGVHHYAPRLLVLLLVAHIGAAFFHHYHLHDNVLRRMWFGKQQ